MKLYPAGNTEERMNGWRDERAKRLTDGRKQGWGEERAAEWLMDRWMAEQIDGWWMDGQLAKQTHEEMDGQIDGLTAE